nr:hypothetical protein CFP56_53129 [Quercus suber]
MVQTQNFSHKSNWDEGKGNGTKCPVVIDERKTVAVMEESPESSKAVDADEAVNPGEIFSNVEANVEGKNCTKAMKIMAIDKEDNHDSKSFDDTTFSVDEAQENRTIEEDHMHVPFNELNTHTVWEVPGPSDVKPKSTWTRINIMDFGLGGLARAITMTGLGKRELRDEDCEQNEQQRNKKRKQDEVECSFLDTSARVDSHPCREQ